jgi:hypothetical protein
MAEAWGNGSGAESVGVVVKGFSLGNLLKFSL